MNKTVNERPHAYFLQSMFYLLLASVAIMAFLAIFYAVNRMTDDDLLGGYRCKELKSIWFQMPEDGQRTKVTLPGVFPSEDGVTAVETILPFIIDEGTYLSLRGARQEIRVYIDGDLRSEYDQSNRIFNGGDSPGAFIFVKLRASDAAKKLRIETHSNTLYAGYVSQVYYGDQTGILMFYMRDHVFEFILAFFLLFVSIGLIVTGTVFRVRLEAGSPVVFLGFSMFNIATWCIFDGFLRQLYYPRLDVVSFISFVALSLFVLPFLLYMNEMQERRYQRFYYILEALSLSGTVVGVVLNLTGIVSYTAFLPVLLVLILISTVFVFDTAVYEVIYGRAKDNRLIYIGYIGFSICGLIEIALALNPDTSMNKIMIIAGAYFFISMAIGKLINDIRRIQAERQEALTLSSSKSRFLASMSHEIRTPINTVLGMNEMIERECNDPNILKYADNIGNAGSMLLSLINDILDFSKIESGKMDLTIVKYQTSSLINDTVTMLSPKAAGKGLKLEMELDKNIPSYFMGDDVRVKQIMTNLLTNAVKYTEKGSVTFSVSGEAIPEKGRADAGNADYRLLFSVKDTGIGIKPENIDKLFLDFSRMDNVKNRHIEGTGLGLAITKLLVEAMHGSIRVTSVYGEGSCFSVTIPQKIADATPMGDLKKSYDKTAKKKSYHAKFRAPEAQILVVDDNKMNLKVFCGLLKKTEIKIDQSRGGNEALDMTRQKKYDLIFMDHMMPDLDGIETLNLLRAENGNPNQDTPTIALTANAMAGIDKMYAEAGFADYLSKPIIPAKLERTIMKQLPKRLVIVEEKCEEAQDE